MISRLAKPEERPALQDLWLRAFGDGPEVTDPFFRLFPPQRHTRVIPGKTGIAAMASWLPVTLCDLHGAYVYAVATAPEHRGKGFARTLLRELEQSLADAGLDFACLCPAEKSLYDYYGALGYEAAFSCNSFSVASAGEGLALTPVDPKAYRAARRQFLAAPFCDWDDAAFAYLEATGTGFYAFPHGLAAAAALPDGTLCVRELLAADARTAAGGICKALGAARAEVFTPGTEQPQGMLKCFTFGQKIPPAHLGFAFD